MFNTELEFTFQDKKFFGGSIGWSSFGGFTVDAYTTPPHPEGQGSYFTCIPISSVEYRRKRKTKANYIVSDNVIVISDDYGKLYQFKSPHVEVIDGIVEECKAGEL